ncbi:Beta-galactosidase [Acidisarcina polymorpha]|uniref:Beta-galactosidase n=1 Tax=Acidisarcina polymorpha TaxID=2211140 RepID=A0A2Z5FW13_9BACT|nr:glycoside hydrolase family 2 TIM barrel-domain containing protein [Acidisarcina polymorpha]AXC10930.1 Beta-galactosidase [Acidisarcina polymorpha]
MDRRDFLVAGTAAAASALAPPAFTQTRVAEPAPGRLILPINRNWRFSRNSHEAGHSKNFDDSSFEQVVVPHSNMPLPWHSFDEKSYEFISLYRRRFKLPRAAQGKRVFVDFEGVMTASTVWINGVNLGEYKGGYTPFSFELTPHIDFDGDNLLAVDVDSTERADIPPFGYQIDYLTFGGIYREVNLRIVPSTFIENIFVQPKDVLSGTPTVDVHTYISHTVAPVDSLTLLVELLDGDKVIAKGSAGVAATAAVPAEPVEHIVHLDNLGRTKLWGLKSPNLYHARVTLQQGRGTLDQDTRRFGFREAVFTKEGFKLNGEVIKLRGLDRHQTFPFVGQAMPARVQRQDAKILRNTLHCNIVRTSHYPQSRHFLDACDDLGLLVLEEIPGWQHIGPLPWQDISVDNVKRMVRRDWNHPSIILWGVRINESRDNHDFYVRTNAMAHKLDPSRPTCGIRYFQESEFLEDVFTMNDFGFPLLPPNHPAYLNTEFVGHTYPAKSIDNMERLTEHTIRHARVHDQLASNPQYAGGIGWCAFDYNTHGDFGSGDRMCYHGVADFFRERKPAGGFYKSQCDPEEEVVLEPAFHWARNDESIGFTKGLVSSNCDNLKFYLKGQLIADAQPDREQFKHLKYAPFYPDLGKAKLDELWSDLRIEGYIGGKRVISRQYSGKGLDQKFWLLPDDTTLVADGADTTRVVLRVTDEFDNIRPYAGDPIVLTLEGPADIIGDNPFGLVGGTGAIWIRAKQQPGTVVLTGKHPRLGDQKVTLTLTASEPEEA